MNGDAHKYRIVPILVWIGLGLFAMAASYELGLGGLHNPGPGLMPFVLGFFLCMTALYVLVSSLHKTEGTGEVVKEKKGRINFGKLLLVLAALFAYPSLLERLGYLLTTLLVLIVLFRSMNNRWFIVVLASILTAAVSYALFTYLGVRFPQGIFRGF